MENRLTFTVVNECCKTKSWCSVFVFDNLRYISFNDLTLLFGMVKMDKCTLETWVCISICTAVGLQIPAEMAHLIYLTLPVH